MASLTILQDIGRDSPYAERSTSSFPSVERGEAHPVALGLAQRRYGGFDIEDADPDENYDIYVYVNEATVDTTHQGDVSLARARAVAEAQNYSDWAEGNVWGFILTDDEGEDIDSVWGFFGDDTPEAMEQYLGEEYHHLIDEAWEARR